MRAARIVVADVQRLGRAVVARKGEEKQGGVDFSGGFLLLMFYLQNEGPHLKIVPGKPTLLDKLRDSHGITLAENLQSTMRQRSQVTDVRRRAARAQRPQEQS